MAAPTGAIAENDPVVSANAALGFLANNEQIVAVCEAGALRCLIKQLLAKASRLEAEAIETTLTTLGIAISHVPSAPRRRRSPPASCHSFTRTCPRPTTACATRRPGALGSWQSTRLMPAWQR